MRRGDIDPSGIKRSEVGRRVRRKVAVKHPGCVFFSSAVPTDYVYLKVSTRILVQDGIDTHLGLRPVCVACRYRSVSTSLSGQMTDHDATHRPDGLERKVSRCQGSMRTHRYSPKASGHVIVV